MKRLKCSWCGGVFDSEKMLYTKDPDYLMCPLCKTVEPGFSEEEEERLPEETLLECWENGYIKFKGEQSDE